MYLQKLRNIEIFYPLYLFYSAEFLKEAFTFIFLATRFDRYKEMARFIYRMHERERISVAEAQQRRRAKGGCL